MEMKLVATKNKMSSEAWKNYKEEGKSLRPLVFTTVPKNRIGRAQRRKMEKILRRTDKNAAI